MATIRYPPERVFPGGITISTRLRPLLFEQFVQFSTRVYFRTLSPPVVYAPTEEVPLSGGFTLPTELRFGPLRIR